MAQVSFDEENQWKNQPSSVKRDMASKLVSMGIAGNQATANAILLGVTVVAVMLAIGLFVWGASGSTLDDVDEQKIKAAWPGSRPLRR